MGMKKVFVFGTENDPLAWKVAEKLKPGFPNIDFIHSDNPDDITGAKNMESIIILDAAGGIRAPMLLSIEDLKDRAAVTTHDIDLGLMLKLLKKTGKIGTVKIIGIPKKSKTSTGIAKQVARLLRKLHVEEMSSA